MWGQGAAGGFQNALAAGLQMGQIARQNQQQDMFMRQREAQIQQQGAQFEAEQAEALRKQDAARVEGELTAAALGGNEEALTQLATRNFDKWKSISGELKAKAVGEAELYGNAALDLLQVPYEQRRGRFIAYSQQFPELGDKIQEVAFLPAEQQETALRAALAEAKMIGKLHEMERPSYQAIPEGGTLVNTRDPAAVQQFQGGAASGGFVEGQTATNPATGQRIVYRNGAWRPM